MKITFAKFTLEAHTLTEMQGLLQTVKDLFPNSVPANTVDAISRPPCGLTDDPTRALRDEYRLTYRKRFTCHGRVGKPLEILTALKAAGWPKQGKYVRTADGLIQA